MKTILIFTLIFFSAAGFLAAQKVAVYALGSAQYVSYNLPAVDAGGINLRPGSGYGGRLGLSLGVPVNLFGKEPGEVIIGLGIDQQRGIAITGTRELTVEETFDDPERIVSVTHLLQGRNAQVLELGLRSSLSKKNARLKLQVSLILSRWGREVSDSGYRSLNLEGVPLGNGFFEPLQVLLPEQRVNGSNPLFDVATRPDNPAFSLSLGNTFGYELGKGIELFLTHEIGMTNSLDRNFYDLPNRKLRFDNLQLGFRGRLF